MEQVSFAQMAMGSNTTPEQFADTPQAGMLPPTMALPSAALDPKAAARAAAAAAAGAKQKQLEVAAVVSSSANASMKAQAAQEAKRKQEDSNRREQLRREAAEEADKRNRQAAGLLQIKGSSGETDLGVPAGHHHGDSKAQSTSATQRSNLPGGIPETTSNPPTAHSKPAGSIDTHAWPAIKPAPGASAPAHTSNVWGARPSSIMQAPPPVEETKVAVPQQKIAKVESAPQKKNAWGNVTLGRAAEVKPGSLKSSALPSSPAPAKDSHSLPLEGGAVHNTSGKPESVREDGKMKWLGDAPADESQGQSSAARPSTACIWIWTPHSEIILPGARI